MEQEIDYRLAPVLEPEPEAAPPEMGQNPPLQGDIESASKEPSPVKPGLRAAMRVRRDALSEKERHAAERRINERLLQHPDVHRAKTVLLYASYGSEVETDTLAKELMKRGKAVAYPKVTAVPGLMTLWRIKNLDALIPHKHGIRAPDVTRSSPIEPLTLDCVIYPGMSFTKGLARLGQGGGYYDRLSAKLADNCARIGVCFETQISDSLPHEAHDANVHWVVTEATVYPYVPDPPPPPILIGAPKLESDGIDPSIPASTENANADTNAAAALSQITDDAADAATTDTQHSRKS
jgi:5-formyltetrahydrofolate cyclo-ligase